MSTLKATNIKNDSSASNNIVLDSSGGVVVSGVTTVSAGSASAPSITPTGDSNTGIFFPAADTIAFAEGGTEILRIDSTGSTLINTTVQTTSNGGLSIATNSSGTTTTPLGLQNRSIGNSSGVYISHRGLTNVGAEFDYNYIQMVADNTTSGTGSIRFHTANGSGPAERVRIDNSGRLLVGTTSGNLDFQVKTSGGLQALNAAEIALRYNMYNDGSDKYIQATNKASSLVQDSNGSFLFYNTNTASTSAGSAVSGLAERLRITSSGAVAFSNGSIVINGTAITSGAGNSTLKWNTSTGLVTYDTSSRIVKENIIDCPYGIDALKQLHPRKYFRTDDQREEIGFIADEMIQVMPEFVPIGPKSVITKDEKDTEQIPIGVNYEKLTAVLAKALQEAVAKIESLEARLTAAGI